MKISEIFAILLCCFIAIALVIVFVLIVSCTHKPKTYCFDQEYPGKLTTCGYSSINECVELNFAGICYEKK